MYFTYIIFVNCLLMEWSFIYLYLISIILWKENNQQIWFSQCSYTYLWLRFGFSVGEFFILNSY